MQKLLIGMGLSLTACGPVVSCVARGARVQTPRGGRAIEDLRVGDEVVVANPATGLTVVSHITAITSATRECGSLEIGGRTLKLTSDHPVYDPVAKGFFPAGDWLLGDRKHLLEIGDDGQQVVQGGDRCRDDDERIGLRRPAQHCLEVGGGVEAVGARRRGTRVGPVVAEGGPAVTRDRAQNRPADEAEPQHADRRSRCSSHRTSVSHCADDLGNRARGDYGGEHGCERE